MANTTPIRTYCKNSILKTKGDRSEPREQYDLEGLGPRYHPEYCPCRVTLQESAYRQPGGQQTQSDVGDRDAEIGGEYDDRHAAHHAEQVTAGDDEEQVADHDWERHHREQAYEDHGDDPGVLMLDPVEKQLYVVPADEDNGAEEGESRDRDRDITYRVRANAAEGYRRALPGRAHRPSLVIVHVNDLIHVRTTSLTFSAAYQRAAGPRQ